MTIHRLAIVERGESALRRISAVAEMNRESRTPVTTIALYTPPDAASWFVREADEAIPLGPAAFTGDPRATCLDPGRLMMTLAKAPADALWLGPGFIAEPAELARSCERAGICFIGPGSEVLRRLGDRVRAQHLAESVDLPAVPRNGDLADGGPSAPGAVRHVEVQVLADSRGAVWTLGVRDCTVEWRHQGVLEESACTLLDPPSEKALRDAAARLCAAAGYRGTGTVGFLVDPATRRFRFLEVGSLRVDNAVAELTTGVNLVKLHLLLAQGGRLPGSPPAARGHAIQARLAVDLQHASGLAPGRVAALRLPGGPGLRVDTGVAEGDEVATGPDSMIAKVTAWGRDRGEALSRLYRGLAQSLVVIEGGTTNKAFLLALIDRPEMRSGNYDSRWVGGLAAAGEHLPPQHPAALVQAAIEAAGTDQAAVQASFYAAAARGRPELPDTAGHRVELSYRGNVYRMQVARLGRDDYRVDAGAGVIDVQVQHLGRYERAVTCFGQRHRMVADTQGSQLIVEVERRAPRADPRWRALCPRSGASVCGRGPGRPGRYGAG